MLVPFAVGLVLLGLAVGLLSALSSRDAANAELEARADRVNRVFQDRLRRVQAQLVQDGRVLASQLRESGPSAARSGAPFAARDADHLTVFDSRGAPVLTSGRRGWASLPLARHLRRASGLEAARGVGLAPRGELVALAAVEAPGVGTVMLGRELDASVLVEVERPLGALARVESTGAGPHRPAPKDLRDYRFPIKVEDSGGRKADLVVSVPSTPIDHTLRSTLLLAAGVGGALILAILFLFRFLVRRLVTAPLAAFGAAMRRVRGGSYEERLAADGPREMRELAEGFNEMTAKVAEQRERLLALAATDPLTGLANHRHFHEALAIEAARATRHGRTLGVVTLDLDHFKAVNDLFGHPHGDDVLRAVGEALRRTVRSTDVVGRLGGEEFGLILPETDPEAAWVVAERARDAVNSVRVEGFELTCSAGLAVFPTDTHEPLKLLQLADGALYWAKRSGRAQTRRYDPRHVSVLSLEDQRAEVEAVLSRPGAICTEFQPLVDLATGRVAGYEALSRFPGEPKRRPDEWFALARRCGLGAQLEAEAIKIALSYGGRPRGTYLALNLSPSVLGSRSVGAALPEDLSDIVIEVTEQELISDEVSLQGGLAELRARGARVALDDAGTGYAGLQHVMRAQPDIIKLDRSLVAGVVADAGKRALIESFTRFARRTGADVCAEGIETDDELRLLADLDVTYGQGFRLARPAPPWAQVDPDLTRELLERSLRGAGRGTGASDLASGGDSRLRHVMSRLSRVDSLTELREVMDAVAAELGADDVAFSRFHPGDGGLERLTRHDWGPRAQRAHVTGHPAAGRVLLTHEPMQVLADDPSCDPAEAALLRAGGFASLLMVPVLLHGESVGLLEVYSRRSRPWTRTETNRALIISYQLGATLAQLISANRPDLAR